MKEAISGNWSTRQLERQINSFHFDRLLISKDKTQKEFDNLMSQFATSSWEGRRKLPYSFSVQGLAMRLEKTWKDEKDFKDRPRIGYKK